MSGDDNSSKRTRASGDVLDYLIREFEINQNPTAETRKEISDKTNMSEKAVRIWFQNRRAKLRKFERMGKAQGARTGSIHSSRSNSLSVPSGQTSPGTLHQLNAIPIEVNEKYCFIDVSSLSVGSWQRIRTGFHDENILKNLVNLSPFTLNSIMVSADLLVLLSKKNFELNYFFSAISNNTKILFRIFYPISSIITCSLLDNNINKESNELRVTLSHQPKFSVYFFDGVNSNSNQWSICEDFSEHQQVSSAFSEDGADCVPHVLVGVKTSLQYLNTFILENNHLQHQQMMASSFSQPPANAFNPDELWDEPIVAKFSPNFESEPSPNSATSIHSQNNALNDSSAIHSMKDPRALNESFNSSKNNFSMKSSLNRSDYEDAISIDASELDKKDQYDEFSPGITKSPPLEQFDFSIHGADFDSQDHPDHVDSFIDFHVNY